uniref:Pre-rRNA-processing protein IPI3 n=1 Tax=Anthurium amnicola TaxID=1678845 RepID=A0A1D1XQM3_9ARAE
MVRLPDPGKLRPESEVRRGVKAPAAAAAGAPAAVAVKLEVEDPLEEAHGPGNKRSKLSVNAHQWDKDASTMYNPLDEPSPLGLRLRKSPSLLDLIQMRLSQASSSKVCLTNGDSSGISKKKDVKSSLSATDKIKASNFPASLLRIGSWECVSRYEGDLVAKCYFAKRKLVWEVLDGGLKSKIEIQWSDITAIKAACPDSGPSTLDIVLARQPLFFKETNPQPRKHTLWQAALDFTDGQASMHRRHFLQVPQGLLSKHFEKLIQCDPRLNSLSIEPDIILDSPHFESRCTFEDQDEIRCHGFDHVEGEYGSPFPAFQDCLLPSTVPSSSSKSEARDPSRTPDHVSRETSSPSSVMDSRVIEENTSSEIGKLNDFNKWDRFKLPGIHPSMSMNDLVNHIGHCISEQMASGNSLFLGDAFANKDVLDEMAQYLLSDSHNFAASDEKSLMSRVNSLCCLLQKDPAVQNMQLYKDGLGDDGTANKLVSVPNLTVEKKPQIDLPTIEGEFNDATTCKQPPMSRKESVGDLLLHLPRIASLPQFFFNISDETDNKAR